MNEKCLVLTIQAGVRGRLHDIIVGFAERVDFQADRSDPLRLFGLKHKLDRQPAVLETDRKLRLIGIDDRWIAPGPFQRQIQKTFTIEVMAKEIAVSSQNQHQPNQEPYHKFLPVVSHPSILFLKLEKASHMGHGPVHSAKKSAKGDFVTEKANLLCYNPAIERKILMAKDELVLLYQIDPSSEKGQKVREILSRLNIRVKTISPAMLHQKIGHLAGLPGHSEVDLIYEGDHIPDEVMLMKDLSDSRIDRILKEFRENGVSRIALKAVVTKHNQNWPLVDLISELRSEHQIMERYSLLNRAVQQGDQLLATAGGQGQAMAIALSAQGQALTAAIAEARVILKAKEAPELADIEKALSRLNQAIADFNA